MASLNTSKVEPIPNPTKMIPGDDAQVAGTDHQARDYKNTQAYESCTQNA
jgi:hypothetical protein